MFPFFSFYFISFVDGDVLTRYRVEQVRKII